MYVLPQKQAGVVVAPPPKRQKLTQQKEIDPVQGCVHRTNVFHTCTAFCKELVAKAAAAAAAAAGPSAQALAV